MNYIVSHTQIHNNTEYSFVVFYANNERMFCAIESSILKYSESICGINNTKEIKNQDNGEFISNLEILIGEDIDPDDYESESEYEEVEDLFDQG